MAEEILKEVEKGINELFADGGVAGPSSSRDEDNNKYLRDMHLMNNPYTNVQKSSVIQSTRDFHDSKMVRDDPNAIIITITQLLHLLNSRKNKSKHSQAGKRKGGKQGMSGTSPGTGPGTGSTNTSAADYTLTLTEATDIFFGVTKLFVSTNHKTLRRMVYVVLKDLIPLCHPSDVIIVTSCLTKDMTSKDSIYKSNALRVLARIIDTSMLSAIERYIKQAILESSSPSSSNTVYVHSPVKYGGGSTPPRFVFHPHGLVSSSALVCSLYLYQQSHENAMIVRRWVNEVYEALRSSRYSGNDMIQFHALILYYQMKRNDRLAISKFVQQFCSSTMSMMDKGGAHGSSSSNSTPSKSATSSAYNKNGGSSSSSSGSISGAISGNTPSLNSPLAITCLIRYTFKLLLEEVMEGRVTSFTNNRATSQLCITGYRFLQSCLRHESEMVAYEAASSICSLSTSFASSNESDYAATLEDIQPALSVLQLLLSSHKPAARLGTIKILYKMSMKYPQYVCGRFNDSLEALIGDSNRLIGTLSIMTLIKTFAGNSNSNGDNTAIDRLLKHISSFVCHIADEYKIMVIKSLEQLCVSYPMKFSIIISFLSKFLRGEGGFMFKRTIVTSIESLMEAIPETRDLALLYLCEFIEDCEYVTLSTQIITLIGNVGPSTTSPARYVRFIYNRCILENAMIRASSVLALSKFGAGCPSLRRSILMLLKSTLSDENDETRDRVVLAIDVLEEAEKRCPYDPSILNKHDDGGKEENCSDENKDNAAYLFMTKLPFTFENLERRLQVYKDTPGAMESNEALTLRTLPIVEEIEPEEPDLENNPSGLLDVVVGSTMEKDRMVGSDAIANIPEFASFGRVFRSLTPIPLTETETEYVVHCVKHIFENHVVFQFITQNTIEDQRLDNVSVSVEGDDCAFEVTGELPAQSIAYGQSTSCYTVLERIPGVSISSCAFNCELKFTLVQVDPATGEEEGESYEEEYPLEELDLYISDFMLQNAVPDFRRCWESIGNKYEILQKFSLQEKDVESAAKAVIDCVGMQTCDGTHSVKPSARQHMLHLSGTFLGGVTAVARTQISRAPSSSAIIIIKIAIRTESEEVSRLVAECLG